MHSENLRAEPTTSTQCRAMHLLDARAHGQHGVAAPGDQRRDVVVRRYRRAGRCRAPRRHCATRCDARHDRRPRSTSSRRNSRALPSRQKAPQSKGFRKATSESQIDQHVLADMRGDRDAAQLLHVPAAQRLGLQAQPDAAAEQAERIVEGVQPATAAGRARRRPCGGCSPAGGTARRRDARPGCSDAPRR